jgi:hypothetical protein
MPDAGRVSAELAAIRERHDRVIDTGLDAVLARDGRLDPRAMVRMMRDSMADVPRLIAAVEAVLEKHVRKPSIRLIPCSEHKRWRGPLVGDNDNLAVRRACPACQVLDDSWCLQCVKSDGSGDYAAWPCPTVAAIERELTGEDGTDDA